jgi:hypothetical protein
MPVAAPTTVATAAAAATTISYSSPNFTINLTYICQCAFAHSLMDILNESVAYPYSSGSQSGWYHPLGGGGITEVGANRYERWKGALFLSQGGTSRQVVNLFL